MLKPKTTVSRFIKRCSQINLKFQLNTPKEFKKTQKWKWM